MTPTELFSTLRQCGVVLVPMVDRVRVDAPKGVLTPALRDALHQRKQELLDLVEDFEERAAIAEYCAALSPDAAEALAWECLVAVEASREGCVRQTPGAGEGKAVYDARGRPKGQNGPRGRGEAPQL